jgi:hypothetical protein
MEFLRIVEISGLASNSLLGGGFQQKRGGIIDQTHADVKAKNRFRRQ